MNWVSEKIIKIGNLHNQKITRTLKPELWNHYIECLERERERETQSNLKNENKESKDTFFLSFLFLVALFFIELVTVAYDVGLF